MKKSLIILCCVFCLPVIAGTRNFLQVVNASSMSVRIDWHGGANTFVPAGSSVVFQNMSTNDWPESFDWPLSIHVPGLFVGAPFSYFPVTSEMVGISEDAQSGSLASVQVQMANMDDPIPSVLMLDSSVMVELSSDFLTGLVAGSGLAAVLFGFRYTKKALGWVDGGGE